MIATAFAMSKPGCFTTEVVHLIDADAARLTLYQGSHAHEAEVSIFDSNRPGIVVGSFTAEAGIPPRRRPSSSLKAGEPLLAVAFVAEGFDAAPGAFHGLAQGVPGTRWAGLVVECDFHKDARLYPGDALLDLDGRFVGFVATGRSRPVLAIPQEEF